MQPKAMVAAGQTPPAPDASAPAGWAPGGLDPRPGREEGAATCLHGLQEQCGPPSPPCRAQQPPWHRQPPSETWHIPHFLPIPNERFLGGWGGAVSKQGFSPEPEEGRAVRLSPSPPPPGGALLVCSLRGAAGPGVQNSAFFSDSV